MVSKLLLNLCRSSENSRLLDRTAFQTLIKDGNIRSVAKIAADEIRPEPTKCQVPSDYVNPLRKPDFFEVKDIFTVKDLFDARVHFGHKIGSLHHKMNPYIFGKRFDHLIIDLEQTAHHLREALNFIAHIAYRGGIILFASNYHQHCTMIEKTALKCGEYAHTRVWNVGLFTDSTNKFGATIKLPDLCIFLSTLNGILKTHQGVIESAKMNIPSVGIVDTNSDPTLITYPIPGNDDSACSIELYLKLFTIAIQKGKALKKKEEELFGSKES